MNINKKALKISAAVAGVTAVAIGAGIGIARSKYTNLRAAAVSAQAQKVDLFNILHDPELEEIITDSIAAVFKTIPPYLNIAGHRTLEGDYNDNNVSAISGKENQKSRQVTNVSLLFILFQERKLNAVDTAADEPSLGERKLQACSTTINPPDVSTGLNVVCSQTRDNVLQAAINAATAGDVICMNPGKYYTACQTRVNKPLTIRGACAGVSATSLDLSFNATAQIRTGCSAAGETVWIASNTKGDSNGGLQGIFVDSSDVTIDGISFYEESETHSRNFV